MGTCYTEPDIQSRNYHSGKFAYRDCFIGAETIILVSIGPDEVCGLELMIFHTIDRAEQA